MTTSNNRPQLIPGQQLPRWSLQSITDSSVPTTESFLGKPLLILFYYLGCPGCKGRAVPYANRLKVELGDKLEVVGIHSNFQGEEYSDEEIRQEMELLYARFPSYRDAGLATTFHDYGALGTPHWVLVDQKGKVVDSIFGSDPNRALLRLDYHFEVLMNEQD